MYFVTGKLLMLSKNSFKHSLALLLQPHGPLWKIIKLILDAIKIQIMFLSNNYTLLSLNTALSWFIQLLRIKCYLVHGMNQSTCEHYQYHTGEQFQNNPIQPQVHTEQSVRSIKLGDLREQILSFYQYNKLVSWALVTVNYSTLG